MMRKSAFSHSVTHVLKTYTQTPVQFLLPTQSVYIWLRCSNINCKSGLNPSLNYFILMKRVKAEWRLCGQKTY